MPDKKLTDNEIVQECPFEEKTACYKEQITEYFSRYKNKSGGEDCIEVCLIRAGYRTVLKAEDEINRLQAKNEELVHKLECLLCHATDSKLSKHTYPLDTMERCVNDTIQEYCEEAQAEAYKEFADKLCEDRVSNDPVVIAAKCLLKELVGDA